MPPIVSIVTGSGNDGNFAVFAQPTVKHKYRPANDDNFRMNFTGSCNESWR